GLELAEEIAVEIEQGKTLIIKYLGVADAHPDGMRHVFFELNGIPRSVAVVDLSLESDIVKAEKADASNSAHIGAAMPGMVVSLAVQEGDSVLEGQKLLVIEAMKMQTTLVAEKKGKVQRVLVKAGSQIETGDLLVVIE
ncbi:pyruvate carboxylase, partial [bacterium]|nr:pyruvate carboxylase [bacterium]